MSVSMRRNMEKDGGWRMEDLALQTGGVYITSELGFHIRKVTREMLGTAHYVKVTGKQTMITGPEATGKDTETHSGTAVSF